MGFSRVGKFVTSKLNNYSTNLAYGSRWLIVIALLYKLTIYLINSIYRNIISLHNNSNVNNINAILT